MRFFCVGKSGRALLLSAAVIAAVALSMGCGGGSGGELVGQWVNVYNNANIDLFKDGTGVGGGESFTWKVEGNRFVFADKNTTVVAEYTLEGYVFTRTFANGGKAVWVRKNKLEEYKKKQNKQNEAGEKKAASGKSDNMFTDGRDGQKYRKVAIGNQVWMGENLRFKIGDSKCYGDDEAKCQQYGRLYNWNEAKMVCPDGWHLPYKDELTELSTFLGSSAGKKLKSKSGWSDNGNGTDEYGFSALPGGKFKGLDGFNEIGSEGRWWSAAAYSSSKKFHWFIDSKHEGMAWNEEVMDHYGSFRYSVRCIMD